MDNNTDDLTKLQNSATPVITQTPKELVEATLKAEDVVNAPKEEVTLSAHEIRTVLTVMRNYLWVSTYQQEEPLGTKVKRNLSIVSYALDYLVMLVENNLTVKKIENNEIKMTIGDHDLVEMVGDVVAQFSEKAIRAGVSLIYEPSVQKAFVKADVQKTKDSIGRILENAIKFTPSQGRVSFKISESDSEDFYEVRISDSGPGIAKYEQADLFKKYGKIDSSYANVRGEDGAGLGLYIAAKYVEMQNGKIRVESDAGAGATFVVSLPKGIDTAASNQA
ncbi:MAG: HAMP domain-containing sensor histidine kinase [Patescibacteria group bacterium]